MSDLLFSLYAVIPMILLISLGYVLKRLGIINEILSKGFNRFVFVVGIPVLLFYNMYNMESFNVDFNIIVFVVVGTFVLFFIGLLFTKLFNTDVTNKSILLQSFIRSNASTIGLQVVLLLGLSEIATANVFAMTGLSVALYNVLGVISFQIYESDHVKIRILPLLFKVIKNPIVVGTILGFLSLAVRPIIGVPLIKTYLEPMYLAIGSVASIASPLSLIALGATFVFTEVNGLKKEVITGIMIRSIFSPLVIFVVAILFRDYFGFTKDHFPTLLAVIVPSLAVSITPMAEYMRGNPKLSSQLIVWTTITSTITMFILIMILKSMNLV